MKHLNLISYFGGKFPHLEWLISLFPKGNFHFIDACCGSANVALNVDYPLVTINDVNENVVNLFEVLRNHYDEFYRAIYYTPYSRSEIERIVTGVYPKHNKIEKARQFFVRSQLGFGANGSQNNHMGFGSEYKLHDSNFYRVDNWNLKLKKLPFIVEKLRSFQIENKSIFDLFPKINLQGTFLYIDPPYSFLTRSSRKRYEFEWSDEDHIKLAEMIKDAKCLVAISGYESTFYNELFSDFHLSKNKVTRNSVKTKSVQECLWTNYNPDTFNNVLKIPFTEHESKILNPKSQILNQQKR